jgi:hypothetical protein
MLRNHDPSRELAETYVSVKFLMNRKKAALRNFQPFSSPSVRTMNKPTEVRLRTQSSALKITVQYLGSHVEVEAANRRHEGLILRWVQLSRFWGSLRMWEVNH